MSPTLAYFESRDVIGARELERLLKRPYLILPFAAGSSRRPSTSHLAHAASSATVTQIHPMSPPWSTAPRCVSPKPAPSTAPSARPTASGSVRSKNSAALPELAHLVRPSCASPPQ